MVSQKNQANDSWMLLQVSQIHEDAMCFLFSTVRIKSVAIPQGGYDFLCNDSGRFILFINSSQNRC